MNLKDKLFYSADLFNSKTKEKYKIKFKNIILACGVTQTPVLINKSLGRKMFNYDMQLHLNLRISAIFKDKIYSEKELYLRHKYKNLSMMEIFLCPQILTNLIFCLV